MYAYTVPELLSTLYVLGGFSPEFDFEELSNRAHGLFTDTPPNSCIMKDTPTVNKKNLQLKT